jgi:preprotein translocase subunit YajC
MFITPAYAQAASGAGSSVAAYSMIPMYLLLFVAFYFLMIRPQQQRAKAHQAAVNGVKKGDSVVTGGGLMGKVTKVDEKFVEVEIATNVKVRAVRATLSEVIPAGTGKPAND